MVAPRLEVADIFRDFGEAYRERWALAPHERGVMRAIELCRTAALGGHLYRCDACGAETHLYNSCGNRHCPKCQLLEKERWIEARTQELLPVPYFHVVFTIPHELHPLVRQNPRLVYNLLFRAVKETVLQVGADRLGARLGMIAVLHTWGSTLVLHPHVHCIIPGGGLSLDGERWVSTGDTFFVPVRVLAALFTGKLTAFLDRAYRRGALRLDGPLEELEHPVRFGDLLDHLRAKRWVVYTKRPFARPETVFEYLARYTHRVAIANQRLLELEGDDVLFRYKDYRRGGAWRTMRLHALEFIRRFMLHVLPPRFVRIRYCGLLGNRHRRENLERCRTLLGAPSPEPPPSDETWQDHLERLTGVDPSRCPVCGQGRLVLMRDLPRPVHTANSRAPP